MNEYEKSAQDFLARHGIKFSAKFNGCGAHFDDDKMAAASRDIFTCTLKKPRRQMQIIFGQSLINSDGAGDQPPTAYDVLACLTRTDPGTLDDFCSDFGFDPDSRRAERAWKLAIQEWRKVSRFFDQEELEELSSIN